MKKLKLKFQDLENSEVLTREQLKEIMGGSDGQNCRVVFIHKYSGSLTVQFHTVTNANCAWETAACAQVCTDLINNGWCWPGNCQSDPYCDGGFGS